MVVIIAAVGFSDVRGSGLTSGACDVDGACETCCWINCVFMTSSALEANDSIVGICKLSGGGDVGCGIDTTICARGGS